MKKTNSWLTCLTITLVYAPLVLGEPPQEREQLYFPTKVGAKWVYQVGKFEDTLTIIDVTSSEGVKTFTIGRVVQDNRVDPIEKIEYSRRGLYRLPVKLSPEYPPFQLLSIPPKSGDEWKYDIPGSGLVREEMGLMKVYDIEEIEVPAGKFKATRVVAFISVFQGTPFMTPVTTTYWYAPEVGLIKKISHDKKTHVLKSFTPGKE
jgi:hypothetical protein